MQARSAAIDRRTVLRGVGVAMALPWLESLPVWGSQAEPANGAAAFPKRFAALFMGNGINPNHWWAKGTGADMELSKTLEPLARLRTKLNVVTGLFNKHATGVGIHPGQKPAGVLGGLAPRAFGDDFLAVRLGLGFQTVGVKVHGKLKLHGRPFLRKECLRDLPKGLRRWCFSKLRHSVLLLRGVPCRDHLACRGHSAHPLRLVATLLLAELR